MQEDVGKLKRGSYKPSPAPPARLSVILAREAPIGLIVRKGPSDWFQMILWHTDADTFEYGQWFHGSFYGGELSPDGSKFLYYVAKYRRRDRDNPNQLYEWAALSKPPFLTALALWPRSDVKGGCLFLDDDTLLMQGTGAAPSIGALPPRFKIIVDSERARPIFHENQILEGWQLQQERIWEYPPGRLAQPEIWKKKGYDGKYAILLVKHTRHDEYLLQHEENEVIPLSNVTWMGWDHGGRFVYAGEGRLLTRDLGITSSEPMVLGDFNSQQFTTVIAPDWALRW